MAKIDKREVKLKKTKKRKIKEILEAESPTSKFTKLDISALRIKSKPKANRNTEATIMSVKNPPKKRKSLESEGEVTVSGKKCKLNTSEIYEMDSNELHEPSLQEINDSLKPENIKAIETGRQKKRAKHQKFVEVNKQSSFERETLRNVEYLKRWKSNRESWKFEKLRQISIQNHLFDDECIDDKLWLLFVEYLSGAKGAAREFIIKKSEEIINEIDGKLTESNKKEMLSLKNYKRAREMLQLLQ